MTGPGDIRFEVAANHSLDKLHERKVAPVRAIETPFPSWNAVCGEEGGHKGIAKGWVVVLGGVTGTGKSYMASNLAANAIHNGALVGLINFEMSFMAVITRHLSVLTGIPKYQLEMGEHFSSGQWQAAKLEADQVYAKKGGALISNESAVFSLKHIEESYAKLAEIGVDMIMVDYAQLVTVDGVYGIYPRSEAVATKLRELTHKYGVVTVAISQLNREEVRSNKPPTIHGLMGGGIWEHSANQIWLLDHTLRERYGRKANGSWTGEYTQMIGGKNRHGMAPVELPLKWNYENMRFDEYVPGSDYGDPFVTEEGNTVEVDGSGYSEETGDLFGDDNG